MTSLRILLGVLCLSLLGSCSSIDMANENHVINWGDSFSKFWPKAKGKSFTEQLALWNEVVEAPHSVFYSQVIWRHNELKDADERKVKRLKSIFTDYIKNSAEIQSNFSNFNLTLETEIKRFKNAFPSTHFKRPIMAVLAPTFNGKSDSYKDNGEIHFLAFGIDTLTIRHDNPDVLYSHELFHLYHGESSGINDDGAGVDALLIDSLWAEGLATYVSKELNPSANMDSIFMDSELAGLSENRLKDLALRFIKIKTVKVSSKIDPEIYGQWFLMNRHLTAETPSRVGYFLGYYVAKILRETNNLDEMAHWPTAEARKNVASALEVLSR